jgi:inhibitor of KinA sporulation pathway (predicted exonuclease)
MMSALKFLGLKHEGKHHRGLDDAQNIARIANLILPRLSLT